MQDEERLFHLAAEAGIEPRYWDIQGRLYETTPDTARALLGGLGLPAGTDSEIAASLEILSEDRWPHLIAPVLVYREHEDVIAPLHLPLDGGSKTIRWSLRLEGGESRSGECEVDSLPLEDTGFSRKRRIARRRLLLGRLPIGYHELHVEADSEARRLLIIAPARCYLPAAASERYWGVAAQLYALNSSENMGVGDFGDLERLIEFSAAQGAKAIGLNPLHALFLNAPEQASPYSPSSRLFRNPLYLDVTAVPDLAGSDTARALLTTSKSTIAKRKALSGPFVDYTSVVQTKLAVLEELYRSFWANHLSKKTARARAFQDFVERSDEALHRFAAFQMLTEHFQTHDWRAWPTPFQDCRSGDVADLARRCADRVSFFAYLQWLCEEQLAQAAETARRRSMRIGLYNDLAVGVDAAGGDHWAHRDVYAGDLRIGAPPDPFNEKGQEWGVIPLHPRQLQRTRYAHFIDLLRANMCCAGALRVDHVMGWRRLFLIPEGAAPADGAYVRYPLDDFLAIAALESRRSRCLLIGEDLGTVPEGFRERMGAENVLSTRILYFERERGRYRPPGDYPARAGISTATHDLPTLRGFWEGEDIKAKARLGIYAGPEGETNAFAERENDKKSLLRALLAEGLISESADAAGVPWSADLARAIHVFLARAPSFLFMAQLDDIAGELHQVNLPGSTIEYPNWRRRQSRSVPDMENDPAILRLMAAINEARS